MTNSIKSILFILSCLVFSFLTAQVKEDIKIEFDKLEGYKGIEAYPLSNGTLLVEKQRNEKKGDLFELSIYDKELKELQTIKYTKERNFNKGEVYTTNEFYYRVEWSYSSGRYQIYRYNYKDNKIKKIEGRIGSRIKVQDMAAIGPFIHIAGTYTKSTFISSEKKFFYQVINTETGKFKDVIFSREKQRSKLHDLTTKNSFESASIEPDELNHKVLVSYEQKIKSSISNSDKFNNRKSKYSVINPDGSVSKYHEMLVTENTDTNFLYNKINLISDNTIFISGSYGRRKRSRARGLYLVRIDEGKKVYEKYYPFGEFKNFTKYLPEKKQKKIAKKKRKKKAQGKELNITKYITMHNIIEDNGIFYQIGECYYPTYTYVTTVDAYGNMTSTQQFDGYQYSHAVIVAFDADGNKLWDNTFEMWLSKKTFRVKQFLTIAIHDGIVNVMFANGLAIKSMSFVNGKVLTDRQVNYASEDDESEKVKFMDATVRHWYSKNYVSFGYQKIKDKSGEKSKKKRRVFFIQLIQYGEEFETEGKPYQGQKKSSDIF